MSQQMVMYPRCKKKKKRKTVPIETSTNIGGNYGITLNNEDNAHQDDVILQQSTPQNKATAEHKVVVKQAI